MASVNRNQTVLTRVGFGVLMVIIGIVFGVSVFAAVTDDPPEVQAWIGPGPGLQEPGQPTQTPAPVAPTPPPVVPATAPKHELGEAWRFMVEVATPEQAALAETVGAHAVFVDVSALSDPEARRVVSGIQLPTFVGLGSLDHLDPGGRDLAVLPQVVGLVVEVNASIQALGPEEVQQRLSAVKTQLGSMALFAEVAYLGDYAKLREQLRAVARAADGVIVGGVDLVPVQAAELAREVRSALITRDLPVVFALSGDPAAQLAMGQQVAGAGVSRFRIASFDHATLAALG